MLIEVRQLIRRTRVPRLALTLAALVSLACRGTSSTVDNLPPARGFAELKPCRLPPFAHPVLCTTVERPVHPQHPELGTLDLAVSVIPAWGRTTPETPPLFMLAGGPGQAARHSFAPLGTLLRRWGQHRDIVLVDLRGTGDSTPIPCPAQNTEAMNLPFDAWLDDALQKGRACRQKMGDHPPDAYLTPVMADDLDAVRQALGYSTIDLCGVSYGTRLALEYARRHEASTRRVVVDGVAPLSIAMPWYFAETFDRAWSKIADYCEQDTACHTRFPEFRGSLAKLKAQVAASPDTVTRIQHPSRDKIETLRPPPELVAAMMFPPSYAAHYWTLMPLAVQKALDGDWRTMAALLDTQEDLSMGDVVRYSIVCNEYRRLWPSPPDTSPLRSTLLGDAMVPLYAKICEAFSAQTPLPATYFEPVRSDKPVLLLSGDADPVTPPSMAHRAAQSLSQSLEVTVPYTGHNTILTECVQTLVLEFLTREDPLKSDTSCVQDSQRPMFFTSVNGPSQDFKAAQSTDRDTP